METKLKQSIYKLSLTNLFDDFGAIMEISGDCKESACKSKGKEDSC